MKVLHITNWYHTKKDPHQVPFIREHFESLNLFTKGFLIHAQVIGNNNQLFSIKKDYLSNTEMSYIIETKISKWFLIEILSGLLLCWIYLRHKAKNYDTINVHTAYPLLAMPFVLWFIRTPILIIEHWTAFHYNFNLPSNTKKLNRIKNIYKRNLRILTVSKQLALDIEKFSGTKQDYRILPNVVNEKIFYHSDNLSRKNDSFFMVNHWRKIKSPLEIFEGFKDYLTINPDAKLRVGGYGELWAEMEEFVNQHNLKDNIILLGKLSKNEIASEMRLASALLHAADYETFSVVCAEAITCGCPVLVTHLSAVAEFIYHGKNGYLKQKSETWLSALQEFQSITFDSKVIAKNSLEKFSKQVVGKKYYEFNKEVITNI